MSILKRSSIQTHCTCENCKWIRMSFKCNQFTFIYIKHFKHCFFLTIHLICAVSLCVWKRQCSWLVLVPVLRCVSMAAALIGLKDAMCTDSAICATSTRCQPVPIMSCQGLYIPSTITTSNELSAPSLIKHTRSGKQRIVFLLCISHSGTL